jgi:hypothetical protein
MASGTPYLSYLLGALGGGGVICAWYGLQRLRRTDAGRASRRLGLILVNAGVVMIAGTLYLIAAAR